MDDDALAARILGTRRAFEHHFGKGVEIRVIYPLRLPTSVPTAPSLPTPTHNPSLDQVRAFLGDCRRCTLCHGRTHLVFGVGNPHADLVVLGEAPGEKEDKRGEPFVGRAGRMLDRMLEGVLGVERDQVYILNVIKCRPPGNRNPELHEIESCLPFLERQLEAIAPKVILLMGAVALRALFQTKHGISRHRGTWMRYADIPVMPTFHPAYLLRKPADKRLTYTDLQALKARLDELTTSR